MKNKIMLVIAFVLGLFTVYKLLIGSSNLPSGQDVKIVEVETVQLKNISQTSQFIGTVRSQQETSLVAKTGGILDILANSGQRVKKGELIAKIINTDVEQNYALLKEAEQIAKLQYERAAQLHKSGVSSKHALEEKNNAWIESQKRLSDAKIALDQINICAPFDGIVGLFKLRGGSQVQAGGVLVSFYDPANLIVEFGIPLSIVSTVTDGAAVFINGKKYALTHVQRMLDEETHMCPAYVRINCDNCIVGSNVDVELVTSEKQDVIVIPFESIFLRNGNSFVYLVKDSKADLTSVELGVREKEQVEITSGLIKGDIVIIKGQARLYPDIPVKISQEKQVKK